MSANPSDRRQRLRDQMKEFYGDPSASPRKTETKKSGVAPNVDMDSEYFDVSKYTTELLRRESLKGLVETDTELLRRVRRLDNELQELVYRNYAKFISATDTIREMHDNISEMDSKLQNLTSNVSNIDSLSQQLTNTLHIHRGKIEETVTVNRMMKKAQFLMGLPETMKKLIDKKEYNTCVKYWVAGDSFLKKHDTIPSIVRVRDECLGLAKNLYTKIEDNMCSYPLDDPEAMDTIRKFVEDLRLLRSTSVSISADDDSFEGTVQKALMRSVAANFASGTAAVQRDVKAALAVPDFSGMEYAKRDQPLAEVNVREALAQLKSVCALLSINSERVYALLYEEENQAVAMRVAQEVQPVLIDLLPILAQLLVPFVNASITAVADEAGAILLSKEKHDTVPHMLSAVVSALLKQLKQLSITLKQLGANYLDTAHSHQSTAYGEMVDKCVVQVLSGVADLLHQKLYEAPTAEAVGRAVGPLRKDDLFVVMPEGKKARREQIAFSLSRYAYASLAALLEENIRTQLVSGEVMSKDSTTEISAQLENVAKDLHHRTIVLIGIIEGEMTAADFGKSESPQSVSETVQGLVVEWASISEWISGLAPPQPTTATATARLKGTEKGLSSAPSYQSKPFSIGSAGRSSDHTNTRGGKLQVKYTRNELTSLQSNVASIFSNKSQTYRTTPPDGRVTTTVGCIVLYLLKYLVESVRELNKLSEGAFHTVQIHCTYLLRALLTPHKSSPIRQWAKIWEESTLQTIQSQLDEICVSAYERYEAKVPLPNQTLDAVVEEALRPSRPKNSAEEPNEGTDPLGREDHSEALVQLVNVSAPTTPGLATAGASAFTTRDTTQATSAVTNESIARHDDEDELPM